MGGEDNPGITKTNKYNEMEEGLIRSGAKEQIKIIRDERNLIIGISIIIILFGLLILNSCRYDICYGNEYPCIITKCKFLGTDECEYCNTNIFNYTNISEMEVIVRGNGKCYVNRREYGWILFGLIIVLFGSIISYWIKINWNNYNERIKKYEDILNDVNKRISNE